jgi:hypothetical protein
MKRVRAIWRKMRSILVLMIAIGGTVLVGCGRQWRPGAASDYELDASSFDAEHLKLVEAKTWLVFPAESKGQNLVWRGRQIDPSFLAKIIIPSNSVGSFVKQIESLPDQEVTLSRPTTLGVSWWEPYKGSVAVERRFIRAASYTHVIVSKYDGVWFCYVEWVSF